MATAIDPAPPPQKRRRLPVVLILWFVGVLAAFIWQAAVYVGLIERAAEWQFDDVGSYFPGITISLLVILFAAPLLYIFSKSANAHVVPTDNPRVPALKFLRFMAVLAGCMLLAAIGTAAFPFVRELTTPTAETALRVDDLRAATPPSGRVKLTGEYLVDRTAIERFWLFGVDRSIRFVPVRAAGNRSGEIRYFAEAPLGGDSAAAMSRSGILRRNGLSGPMVALFRDAGFKVATPHYVLYTSRTAERIPYITASLQFALCALIAGLVALYQRWRLRKISSGRRKGTPHAIG